MHISSTAPDAKMADIRFLLVPEFIRSSALDARSRATIAHMHKGAKSFTPELTRETRLIEHGSHPFRKNAVRSLCNSILLRTIANGVLALNPMQDTELLKLS
jgi:hypothetical protein